MSTVIPPAPFSRSGPLQAGHFITDKYGNQPGLATAGETPAPPSLCEHTRNHLRAAGHAGEAFLSTAHFERELTIVQTHRSQNGRVQIAEVNRTFNRHQTQLVGS